jgi:glyoxylase-like metal-dependent hydrolase (beta-lactamase superfamily II)
MSITNREPELRELRPGAYAYLQHGSWGYSNAGLITDGDASLLVDTLYDLRLTQRMLDTMKSAVPSARRIGTLVNTHANGDHCWGNQLVGEAEIVSSRAAAQEMLELSPKLMHTLLSAARRVSKLGPRARSLVRMLGKLGVPRVAPLEEAAEFALDCFGSFEFEGITLTPPTTTFNGALTLHVGSKQVELIEVGPAHTKGDVIVYCPADRIVWTGDILFIDAHPILWEGPVRNWVAACDRLLALDVDVIVPGHGPLTDKAGVQRVKDYWLQLTQLAERGRAAGASTEDLARQALADGVRDWTEAHRVIANLDAIRRELEGDLSHRDPLSVMAMMSRLER